MTEKTKEPNCQFGYCPILDEEGVCIVSQAFNGRRPNRRGRKSERGQK